MLWTMEQTRETEQRGAAQQRVTIRDVAQQTGLSIATVSRVLNGRSNVAPDTRDLVHQAMGGLGRQRPDGAAPRPEGGQRRLRALPVCADRLLRADRLRDRGGPRVHGMHAIVAAGESSAKRTEVLKTLTGWPQVIGALLILPSEPEADLERLRDQGFPFVVVDPRTSPPRDIAAVSAANFAGARRLVAHLTRARPPPHRRPRRPAGVDGQHRPARRAISRPSSASACCPPPTWCGP